MISSKQDYEFIDWSRLDPDAEINGTIIPIEDTSNPVKDAALRIEDFTYLCEAFLQRAEMEQNPTAIKEIATSWTTYTNAPVPSKDSLKKILRMAKISYGTGQPLNVLKGTTPFSASGWTSVTTATGTGVWERDIIGSSNFMDYSLLPTESEIDAMVGFEGNVVRKFYRYLFGENNDCPWVQSANGVHNVSNATYYPYIDSKCINSFRYWGSSLSSPFTSSGSPTTNSIDLGMSGMPNYYDVGMGFKGYQNQSGSIEFYSHNSSYLKPITLNVQFGTRRDYAQGDVKVVMQAYARPNQSVSSTNAYAKIFTPTRVGTGLYQILDFFPESDFESILGSSNHYTSIHLGRLYVRERGFMLPPGVNWTWQPS